MNFQRSNTSENDPKRNIGMEVGCSAVASRMFSQLCTHNSITVCFIVGRSVMASVHDLDELV